MPFWHEPDPPIPFVPKVRQLFCQVFVRNVLIWFLVLFPGGGPADRALTFNIQTSAPLFKICHLYFFLKRQCYAWIWYKFSPIIPPLTWKIQSFHIYYLYCFWATRFVRNVLLIWYVRLFSLVGGGACRVLITLVFDFSMQSMRVCHILMYIPPHILSYAWVCV